MMLKKFFNFFLIISLTSLTLTIKVSKSPKGQKIIPNLEDYKFPEIKTQDSEQLSAAAIERLKKREKVIGYTSCKVTAQYILFTASGVDEEEDLKILELTNKTETDLKNIRDLLMDNKIIQIEIKPNHHFVIFKKNDEYMYLLQGFQDIFYLSEWMDNEEVMKPHWKIDDFFKDFAELLDRTKPKERQMELLRKLFYPDYFSKDEKKIQAFNKWFDFRLPVYLINVSYAKYKFTKDIDSPKETYLDFHEAARNYNI